MELRKQVALLVVEDEPDFLDEVVERLRDLEYGVVGVPSLVEAQMAIRQKEPSYDLVLLDLRIPERVGETPLEEYGYRFIEECTLIDLPVIVLTVNEERETEIACLKAGARDYVLKDRIIVPGGGEQKLAIENLDLRIKVALQAREIEMLSFLAVATHDLRSPFSALLSYVKMLIEDREELTVSEQERVMQIIYRLSRQQLDLIDDLLDYSRIRLRRMEFRPSRCPIGEAVAECCVGCEILAREKGIAMNVELDSDLPEIMVDVPKIQQVITNLVMNAVKFTEEGGRITVQVRGEERGIRISVTDTGRGIAEADLVKLFEPYQPVRSEGTRGERGTGLGLTICRAFVELHGGEIQVESQVGKGSTFSFTLPLRG
jgi:signal transduction histidine kinase